MDFYPHDPEAAERSRKLCERLRAEFGELNCLDLLDICGVSLMAILMGQDHADPRWADSVAGGKWLWETFKITNSSAPADWQPTIMAVLVFLVNILSQTRGAYVAKVNELGVRTNETAEEKRQRDRWVEYIGGLELDVDQEGGESR